jgi:hypothetical protein
LHVAGHGGSSCEKETHRNWCFSTQSSITNGFFVVGVVGLVNLIVESVEGRVRVVWVVASVLDTVLEVEDEEDDVVAAEFDDFVVDLEDDEDVVVLDGFIVETTNFAEVSREAVVIPDFRVVAPTALVNAPGWAVKDGSVALIASEEALFEESEESVAESALAGISFAAVLVSFDTEPDEPGSAEDSVEAGLFEGSTDWGAAESPFGAELVVTTKSGGWLADSAGASEGDEFWSGCTLGWAGCFSLDSSCFSALAGLSSSSFFVGWSLLGWSGLGSPSGPSAIELFAVSAASFDVNLRDLDLGLLELLDFRLVLDSMLEQELTPQQRITWFRLFILLALRAFTFHENKGLRLIDITGLITYFDFLIWIWSFDNRNKPVGKVWAI